MADYDLIVRNAKIVTAERQSEGDIAVKDGKVAALGADVKGTATREIDAAGKFVLPGGVDSHCHIEQRSGMGVMCADDFYTGTVSAAFGGTTTVIPFAAQHRGMSLRQVVKDYHEAATPKAVIDYAFHLIITDPTQQVLGQELPALIKDGYTSFKIYMTYDAMKVSDYQILDILALARRDGALVMVHAENHDMIQWLAHHLVDQGHVAPKFHAIAHARVAEAEATNRAISLARLVDAPLLLVHMSEIEAIETLRQAQKKGLKIFGETCPQYIALTADDMDKPGVEGAMWCCSPPPRDSEAQEAVWAALKDGTFQTFSSDHAPYQFNEKGKIPKGDKTTFKEMANGVPGLEIRLPILFSEGVQKGRITLQQFVALTSANHAKLYGLYPKKGTIAVGSDADFAIWDADKDVTIRWKDLHDNVGYSPYEGRQIKGWPITVVSRGASWSRTASSTPRAARASSCPAPRRIPPSPRDRRHPSFRRCRVSRQAAVLMIGVDYVRRMARYNRWQNENLYGAADGLTDEERHRARGAFFGSIHRTMCHLLWADQTWMSRFSNSPPPVPLEELAGAASGLGVAQGPTDRLRCGHRPLGGLSRVRLAGWHAYAFLAEPGARTIRSALDARVALFQSPDSIIAARSTAC